mmetsp:Transcript_13309/g.23832  ORF Transcript_13309/g.23832 Transcript_13309/m.23832 type:complete len:318 (+) Transcript_13309:1188-2141(+)
MDGAATGDNTGFAIDGHRDVSEEDAGVDCKVIDSLLSLLNERLSEDIPVQVLSNAINLLQGLINWHSSHRNRTIPHDPLPCLLNVLPRTQIHQSVGSPHGTPLQLLDLFLNARRNRRVPNISIDLHLEHPPNNLRLQFKVILVRRNNGTSARHLATHELSLDILTFSNVLHFLGNHTLAREVHLGVSLVLSLAGGDPLGTDLGEAFLGIDATRARGVVEVEVGHIGILEVDTSEWDVEYVTRGFVHDRLEFLCGVGECIVVRDGGDAGEFGVERVFGGLRAAGALDVGFSGDEFFVDWCGHAEGGGCRVVEGSWGEG